MYMCVIGPNLLVLSIMTMGSGIVYLSSQLFLLIFETSRGLEQFFVFAVIVLVNVNDSSTKQIKIKFSVLTTFIYIEAICISAQTVQNKLHSKNWAGLVVAW